MNWGKAIVLSFILFFCFIGFIVYKAMNEDISLVSENYYTDELKYQTEIESKVSFDKLAVKPTYSMIDFKFLLNFNNEIDSAVVQFYKPNNKKLDFKLKTNSSIITYDFSQKSKGLWKAKTVFYKKNTSYSNEFSFDI